MTKNDCKKYGNRHRDAERFLKAFEILFTPELGGKYHTAGADSVENQIQQEKKLIAEPDSRKFDGAELSDHHGIKDVNKRIQKILQHNRQGYHT